MSHVRDQLAQIVLVTPVWKSQPWYPVLLEIAIDCPRLIVDHSVIVNQYHVETMPQLAVWHIARRDIYTSEIFQTYLIHGDQKPTRLMTHSLGNGIAGVFISHFWSYN